MMLTKTNTEVTKSAAGYDGVGGVRMRSVNDLPWRDTRGWIFGGRGIFDSMDSMHVRQTLTPFLNVSTLTK